VTSTTGEPASTAVTAWPTSAGWVLAPDTLTAYVSKVRWLPPA
jgi:hypothetical protein